VFGELIVGTGGSNHTTVAAVVANGEVRNASTYGVLKLRLHPSSYDWEFAPEAGATFTDGGTAACSAPPPTLFADDFETGDLSRWTGVSGLRVDAAEVHGGSWAARASSGGNGAAAYATKQLSAAQGSLTTRLWFKVVSQGNNVIDLFKLRTAAGSALLTLFASQTGVLGYQNNVTTRSVYSRTPLSPNAWHQLEVRVTINDANSQVQTWLDGQPLADLSRTESLGTSPIGRLQLGENIGGRSYELALDDVALTP
jgi:hypothetical protein